MQLAPLLGEFAGMCLEAYYLCKEYILPGKLIPILVVHKHPYLQDPSPKTAWMIPVQVGAMGVARVALEK